MTVEEQIEKARALLIQYETFKITWTQLVLRMMSVLIHGYEFK